MERTGMSIQVIPAADGSGDHGFLISQTRWIGASCEESRIQINKQVHLTYELSGRPDNLLWMLDLLEVAKQLVSEAAGYGKLQPIRGTNPQWPDTTGKPLQL